MIQMIPDRSKKFWSWFSSSVLQNFLLLSFIACSHLNSDECLSPVSLLKWDWSLQFTESGRILKKLLFVSDWIISWLFVLRCSGVSGLSETEGVSGAAGDDVPVSSRLFFKYSAEEVGRWRRKVVYFKSNTRVKEQKRPTGRSTDGVWRVGWRTHVVAQWWKTNTMQASHESWLFVPTCRAGRD